MKRKAGPEEEERRPTTSEEEDAAGTSASEVRTAETERESTRRIGRTEMRISEVARPK